MQCDRYDHCLTRCDDGLDAGLPACARLREGVLLAVQVGQLVAALLHDVGEVQGVPLPKVRHMAGQVEAWAGQQAQSATMLATWSRETQHHGIAGTPSQDGTCPQ